MKKLNGKYLKSMRVKQGLSIRAFADKIYVSKSTVDRWEKSFVPDDEAILSQIAQIFDVSVDEMLTQSEAFESEKKSRTSAKDIAEAQFGIKGLLIVLGVVLAVILLIVLV